ncbi:MAG: TIGR02186 family protein [Sneathiella sp.]|nr:TIGR02186 family protein [Sneathiella sp.]
MKAAAINSLGHLALFATILTSFSLFPLSKAAADSTLVTDISSHLISVTSDFTGTELLLFGTIQSDNDAEEFGHDDLVIVVRGPRKNVVVRRKDRIAGIWMNTASVEFEEVPSFYALASNRPVEEITSATSLNRLKIGPVRLGFLSEVPGAESFPFQEAIVRQKSEDNLYSDRETAIHFLGDTLFRTTIDLPANVPVGDYVAEFFLFRDGDLISAQSSPLFIKKSGIGRTIYDFAHDYSVLYGIAANIIALFAGWIASVIYRKD